MGANELALGGAALVAGALTAGFGAAVIGGVVGAVAADKVMPAIGLDLEAS